MFDNGLDIQMHGGQCCGIKTICGFNWGGPYTILAARAPTKAVLNDSHGMAHAVNKSFFHAGAPAEPEWERFNRYMDFLAKRRPEGLVEVVLIPEQRKNWDKLLKDSGFKEVCEFVNSNSKRTLTVYHFIMGKDKFTPLNPGPKPASSGSIWTYDF